MERKEKQFSIQDVRALIINAYEVGYQDGIDSELSSNSEDFRAYRNAEDFWNKNETKWLTEPINYVL